MRNIKSFTLIILIGIVAVGLTVSSARAGVEPSPFIDAFNLQTTGGVTNPGVLIGFNPQPEPPGVFSVLNLLNPALPSISIENVSGDQTFQLVFAMSSPNLFFNIDNQSTPDATGHFEFFAFDGGRLPLFTILFDLTTSSGGVVDELSWTAFNPQPEPPGFEANIGFNFGFTSLSTATLSFQILDSQDNSLNFAPAVIPLPAALPLYGTGLAVMGFLGWRRKRKAAA